MDMDTAHKLMKMAGNLMASFEGQCFLLGLAVFGIFMLRGPNGKI